MKLMVHVSGPLKWNVVAPTDDTIRGMLEIEKSVLSQKYDLPVLSRVKGEIQSDIQRRRPPATELLEEDKKLIDVLQTMDEFHGKEIELVLWSPKIGLVDFLHITKKTWREVLVVYGILPTFYDLEFKLMELMEYEEVKK